jgi:hypothetical protein
MSFAEFARRTFRRTAKSHPDSARTKAKLAVTLLEDRSVPATVGVTVFYDGNGDHIQDAGENYAVGVGVTLFGNGQSVPGTTDVNGYAPFAGVSPGSYSVAVSAPSGYTAELANGSTNPFDVGTDDVGVGFGLEGGGAGSGSGSGPPPTVTISKSDTTEGVAAGSSGYFRFTRSGSTANDVTVNYTLAGTATSGTDYTALSGSVTIPSGQSFADADVTALADNLVEGSETIIATISSDSAYTVGTPSTATLNITDDPPIVSLTQANTTEGGTPGYVTFSRTGGDIDSALTVTYTVGGTATPGADYTALSGSISIPAGQPSANVNITALPDNLIESDETVTLEIVPTGTYLLPGSANSLTSVVTISDDPATISVANTADATEGGGDGNFEFTRTGGDVTQSLTVSYTIAGDAVPGVNYTALSGSVTFAANSLTAEVSVAPIDDGVDTSGTTVVVSIDDSSTYVAGAGFTASALIHDSDPPQVSVKQLEDAAEGGSGADGVIQFSRTTGDLSSSLTITYTISGTAVPGTHYQALSGSVTIPADSIYTNVDLTPIVNSFVGSAKTVIATISSEASYTISSSNSATVNINNADPGEIDGNVWSDDNDDGLEDTGEGGFLGAVVNLVNSLGDVIASQTSNSSGNYSFAAVSAGSYFLAFVPPLGDSLTNITSPVSTTVTADSTTEASEVGIAAPVVTPTISLNQPSVTGSSISGGGTFSKSTGTFVSITLFASGANGLVYNTTLTSDPGGANWGTSIANAPNGLPKGAYDVWAVLVVSKDGKQYAAMSKRYSAINVAIGSTDPTPSAVAVSAGFPMITYAKDTNTVTAQVNVTMPIGDPGKYTGATLVGYLISAGSGNDGSAGGLPYVFNLSAVPDTHLYKGSVDMPKDAIGTKYSLVVTGTFTHPANTTNPTLTFSTPASTITVAK